MMIKVKPFILTIMYLSCVVFSHSSQAVELKDDNFFDFIKKTKNVIVLFYEKKCPNCADIEKETILSMEKHQPADQKWVFAKFNVHKYHEYLKVLHVHQFPRIRFYFDNEFHRTLHSEPLKKDVDEFLQELSLPAPRPRAITKDEEIQEFKAQKLAILCVFPDNNDKTFYFSENLQKAFPGIPVYSVLTGSKLDVELFGADSPTYKVLLKRSFDDGNKEIKSYTLLNPQTVLNLINSFKHEKVQILNKEGYDSIMSHRHMFIVIFDHLVDSANVASAKSYLLNLHYTGQVYISNLKEEGFGENLGNILGVNPQDFPVMLIVKNHEKRFQKYKYAGNFSQNSLTNFMNLYLEKKVPEYLRSQPVVDNKDKKVQELVAANFDSFIKNTKSHVVALFYKENDNVSNQLVAQMNTLYKHIHESNNVVFVKCNADLNDFPFINARSLPEVYFFSLDKKDEPIHYKASTHVDDFVKFFEEKFNSYVYRRSENQMYEMGDL